jgi:5-methylcytosine-specific restriction endonuclease McrA
MKKCCHCKRDLPLDSFQKNRATPDGLQHRCKDCTKEASKVCRAKRGHLWLEKTNPWSKRPENRLRANAKERIRRAKNPEKVRKENRKFREQNPFSVATVVANGRAKKLGIDGVISSQDWKNKVYERNFICHICGDMISLEIGSLSRLSLDHVIPLSRGGKNTIENVAPAHRICNQIRNQLTLGEFDVFIKRVSEFRNG